MKFFKILAVIFLIYFIRRFIQMYRRMQAMQEAQQKAYEDQMRRNNTPKETSQSNVINADFKVVD